MYSGHPPEGAVKDYGHVQTQGDQNERGKEEQGQDIYSVIFVNMCTLKTEATKPSRR